jgi:hypothetical protein
VSEPGPQFGVPGHKSRGVLCRYSRYSHGASLLFAPLFLAMIITVQLAPAAWAAPNAAFTANKVQGPTCVAPCAVHFDAIGNGSDQTTDPDFSREFHSLLFQWDFGDPGAGTWPVSGGDKNREFSAIAGHLYERPGSYVANLVVTNPNGEAHTAQQVVVVADPDAHFGPGETYCFANSGTPGGAGFEGCPVSLASQHIVLGAGVSDGFNQALQTPLCNVRSGADRRCLFRRGDSWRAQGPVFVGDNAGVGLIDAFGTGSRPRIEAAGDVIFMAGDHWTMANVDVVSNPGFLMKLLNEVGHTTVYNVKAVQLTNGCFVSQGTSSPTHSDLVAVIEVECLGGTSGLGGSAFFRTERTLVLGSTFDNNYQGEFAFRTIHFPRSVLQHSRLMRPQEDSNNQRNVLQLRAWAGTANGVPGTLPAPTNTEYVVISDNVLSQDNSKSIIRTCQGNECVNAADSPELQHVIIERNFFYFSSGGCCGGGGMAKAFWLQGGDITVRNNVIDLQGIVDGTDTQTLALHDPNLSGSNQDDRIHVLNNTVYYDDAISIDDFRFCGGSSIGTGHLCQNNLAWLPNHSGLRFVDDGPGWTSSSNVFATTNPFAAPIPQQGATDPANFQPDPQGTVVDGGSGFTGSSTHVALDFGLRCRPADGPDADSSADWDVGAWEEGASPCWVQSAIPTAPILLP